MSAGTVLITGASSGIGLALAECFAREGHDLVLASRDGARLAEIATDLQARFGIKAGTVPVDLSRPGAASALAAACPRIDILVNNAGFGIRAPFLDSDPVCDAEMLQLNVVSLVELTRIFARAMSERGAGRILNVSSTSAFQPGPFMSTYAAGKAFVLRFGEGLREELRNTGVTVTTLCPGPTATGFNRRAGVPETAAVRMASMRPERAARAGYRGLMRGRNVVIPGFWNRAGSVLVDLVPGNWLIRALGAFQRSQRI